MRCVVLTRLAVALVLLPIAGGCSVLRLNEGREFAVYSAGYAGRFHLEPVCTLRVLTPQVRSETDVFPMVVIKTGVFSCRGKAEAR